MRNRYIINLTWVARFQYDYYHGWLIVIINHFLIIAISIFSFITLHLWVILMMKVMMVIIIPWPAIPHISSDNDDPLVMMIDTFWPLVWRVVGGLQAGQLGRAWDSQSQVVAFLFSPLSEVNEAVTIHKLLLPVYISHWSQRPAARAACPAQLRGAVAAYNFGSKNVQTKSGIDSGTASTCKPCDGNYSWDTVQRARWLADN